MILDLFPLPSVLFPGSTMPLHIFEARYLEMIGRCVEERKPFGVILLKSGRAEGGGPVEIHKVGTTAHVISRNERPDGTVDIHVAGERRFEVVEIVQKTPRAIAQVRTLDWDEPAEEDVGELSGALRALFDEYLRLLLSFTGQWARSMGLPRRPASLAGYVSAGLQAPELTKQGLLETSNVRDLMGAQIEFLRAEVPRLKEAVGRLGASRSN